jgi:hypothetical protein
MARDPAAKFCLSCKYSLVALPKGVCPECGRGFDPADPATFYVPRMFMLSPGWSRAPDWGHFVIAAIGSILVFWSHWLTVTDETLLACGVVTWVAIGAPCIVRAVLRLVPQSRHRLKIAWAVFWRREAILTATVALTLAAVLVELPMRIRFISMIPTLGRIADSLQSSSGNMLDVEGKYPAVPGLKTAFKVKNGEAIEVWSSLTHSFHRQRRYFSRTGTTSLVARIRSKPGQSVESYYGRFRVEHLWGEWYLLYW